MTLKELAKVLNTPLGNLIRKAKDNGLPASPEATLTESQIEILKASDEVPALKPSLPPQSNPEPQSEASEIAPTNQQTESIATRKERELQQAIQAESEQFNHQAEARLQQRFADGQYLGVLEGIAENQGRVSGYLAVSQVAFNADLARRHKVLNELAAKVEGTDFFGSHQSPAESYYKSSQVAASTNANVNQILQNLASN